MPPTVPCASFLSVVTQRVCLKQTNTSRRVDRGQNPGAPRIDVEFWAMSLVPWQHRLTFFVLACSAAVAQTATVEFNRDIRPILSDRCYTCHGPDESKRKSKLRL